MALAGIVRRDITTSVDGASGVAEGIPLTVKLTLLDGNNGCTPTVAFTTIFPACYSGRWPHMHFEASVANLRQVSLTSDMVFADGVTQQMPTITGSVGQGFVAKLSVTI